MDGRQKNVNREYARMRSFFAMLSLIVAFFSAGAWWQPNLILYPAFALVFFLGHMSGLYKTPVLDWDVLDESLEE
ncbi:MAG: fatty acid desaturase [Paracoccaceae bacterium]|jgi:fatty acid desaturase